jgi:hypothetical protein
MSFRFATLEIREKMKNHQPHLRVVAWILSNELR